MLRQGLAAIIALTAALCMNPAAHTRNEAGRVMAGRAAVAPVIDGVLDDACWDETVELHPFTLLASIDQAEEQTRAYITYDNEYLYVGFRMDEFALDPRANILHEFRMDVKEDNDDGIFNDDAAVLILDPGRGKVYDIFINANGAVNSASGDSRDSWSTRDTGWGEGIKAAAEVRDGFWTVEAAVPFSLLGEKPGERDVWGICLGRLQQRKGERSSWQPMEVGFHAPEHFGELEFGRQVPGIRVSRDASFDHGANELGIRVDPSGRRIPVRIESSVEYAGQRRRTGRSDRVVSDVEEMVHEYELESEGDVIVRYEIINPAALRVYYRSPRYRGMISSTGMEILKAGGEEGYRIYLNGTELKNGASLYRGANILAIESAGKVSAEFAVGDYRFSTAGDWRYSASAPDGWRERGFSDAGWDRVSAGPDGTLEGKGHYRRTILFGHSMFWPNWEMEGLWVAENSIQQMFLAPQGLEGRRIGDYSFYLEVPEEFKVIGASSYYNYLPSLGARLEGSIVRDGSRYSRYLIHTTDTITRRESIPLHNYAAIGVELPESGEEFAVRDAGPFYYYLQAEGGAIMEIPQSLRVNILPPLRGKQPQTYHWQLWTGWLPRMNDADFQERMYNFFQTAGFNEASLPGVYHEDTNLGYFSLINFDTWNINMRPYLAENPNHALLDNEGVRRHIDGDSYRNQVCTTLLLRDSRARAFMEEALTALVKDRRLDHVNWDYESSVWNSYISCYCERCMGEFRKFAGISGGTALGAGIIKETYPSQWKRFMHVRMAELAGIFSQVSRAANPDAVFSVYSGYQSARTKEIYGVDWSLLQGRIDLGMAGYGRQIELIDDTLEALGDTPLVLGAIVTPYSTSHRSYPNYISKARLLRRAVEGTGGVLFYTLASFSGRTLYSSAEISRLVSEYEDIFVKNRREDGLIGVSGISAADTAVLTDGETRIVMLFNEGSAVRRARVVNRSFTSGMRVLDYYRQKDLGNLAAIEAEIPPNDVKVYIIR